MRLPKFFQQRDVVRRPVILGSSAEADLSTPVKKVHTLPRKVPVSEMPPFSFPPVVPPVSKSAPTPRDLPPPLHTAAWLLKVILYFVLIPLFLVLFLFVCVVVFIKILMLLNGLYNFFTP
jgi:hypothetical protein